MNNNPKCFCGRDAWRPLDGEKHHCIFHSPKIEEKIDEFSSCWEKFLLDRHQYQLHIQTLARSLYSFYRNEKKNRSLRYVRRISLKKNG